MVNMMDDTLQKRSLQVPKKLVIVANLVAVVSAAIAIAVTYLGVFPFQSPLGLYPILPGDILIDFIWIWGLAIVFGLIVYLISPFLANLFLGLHRILTGGSYDYHIQKRDSGEHRPLHSRRLITPALVCLGLSFSITKIPDVANALFVMDSFDHMPTPVADPLLASMPLFFVLLLLASFISILFAPVWFLEDVGIICEKKSTGTTADIMGVGNWYLILLKGFAGISTVLAYIFVSIDMIAWFQALPTYGVEVPIWLFLIPVMVVIASPLIALAPISVAYIFYLKALSKSSSSFEKGMIAKGFKQVSVEVRT